jgi:hypothetical protein
MIAQDTGHRLVLEDEFRCSMVPMLAKIIKTSSMKMVIQCPFLSHIIHDLEHVLGVDPSEALVVFMHRYRRDIVSSECRAPVNFQSVAEGQRAFYHAEEGRQHISDIKYEAWEDQQRVIAHSLDVGYESLSDHPLWVRDRSGFEFQHEIGEAKLPRGVENGIRDLQDL